MNQQPLSGPRQADIDIYNIYPSIEDLVPLQLMHLLPYSLVVSIRERYTTLGGKYMTGQFREDGREINNVVNCDNLQSTLEEIIDSIFNWLAWSLVAYGEVDVDRLSDIDAQDNNPSMAEAFGLMVRAYTIVSQEAARASGR